MVLGSLHIKGHLDFRVPFARLQELYYQVVVEGVSYGVSLGGKPHENKGKILISEEGVDKRNQGKEDGL